MYEFRKLVGLLASPMIWALACCACAVFLRLRGRAGRARWLFVAAAVIGYFGCTRVAGDALLAPLEALYPPLAAGAVQQVGYVVVLGSGYSPHDGIPVTAALSDDGLARIVEGLRLLRRQPKARILVSGGAPPGQGRPAQGYARLAMDFGVPAQSIIVSDTALDTAGEAREIAVLLAHQPFLLVTSAYHMPRAVRLLRRFELNPIAAPTGQMTRTCVDYDWHRWLPTGAGLARSERALHEYLGLAALALRQP